MPSFDLIERPWLPCIKPDGKLKEVNLREALLGAHDFLELRDASPLVTCALHRLLLAILHRAYEGPQTLDDWAEIHAAKQFNKERVGRYLDKMQKEERFDLLHAKRPFYQIAGFEVASKACQVTQLAQEFARGNNSTLFDHTSEEGALIWPFAVSAKWLVVNQAFAVGGGAGATSNIFGKHPNLRHAPMVGGVATLLRGDSLFETLLLNLLRYSDESPIPNMPEDLPAWERSPMRQPSVRPCKGWLDLLTWQSRCIRLVPEEDGVRIMHYAQGEGLEQDTRPMEPMWFFRLANDNEPVPIRIDPDRALWRSADSLFGFSNREGKMYWPRSFGQIKTLREKEYAPVRKTDRYRCAMLGMANDKTIVAKVLDWSHQDLPVPARLLEVPELVRTLRHGLEKADKAGSSLRMALFILARELIAFDPANKKSEKKPPDAGNIANSLEGEPRYWGSLEIPFKTFLSELEGDADSALKGWMALVHAQALQSFRAVSENSLGYSPRELKARVDAEAYLALELYKLEFLPKKEVAHVE